MSPINATYLQATPLLDFNTPAIQTLIAEKEWQSLTTSERIGAIYHFIQNDVAFGYNKRDDIAASEVLKDGLGQCNTKATLLMALLRATGIACRLHGFTIDKRLQKGAITGLLYILAPRLIIHSWVEVQHDKEWISLEGFILDNGYLNSVQKRFPKATTFSGYAIATKNLQSPNIAWCGKNTFIQSEGIVDDFGIFDSPDTFYQAHGNNLKGFKSFLYENILRHSLNRRIDYIRSNKL